MYKAIFIDLDGTLLQDNKKISKKNIDTLNKVYKEKSILPVITTGRNLYCAEYISSLIGECCGKYVIASNGAVIKDFNNNVLLLDEELGKEKTLEMLKYCNDNKMDYIVETDKEGITNVDYKEEKEEHTRIGVSYKIINDVYTYIKNNNEKVMQMTVIGNEDELDKLKKEINTDSSLQITNNCVYRFNKGGKMVDSLYVNVMKNGSTKANAIQKLVKQLNIKKEEIIVIGDGGNDMEMFDIGGLKIAMENGVQELKEKADYITASNNESGVAKAIQKFIF